MSQCMFVLSQLTINKHEIKINTKNINIPKQVPRVPFFYERNAIFCGSRHLVRAVLVLGAPAQLLRASAATTILATYWTCAFAHNE